jgi:hypothetical protein
LVLLIKLSFFKTSKCKRNFSDRQQVQKLKFSYQHI